MCIWYRWSGWVSGTGGLGVHLVQVEWKRGCDGIESEAYVWDDCAWLLFTLLECHRADYRAAVLRPLPISQVTLRLLLHRRYGFGNNKTIILQWPQKALLCHKWSFLICVRFLLQVKVSSRLWARGLQSYKLVILLVTVVCNYGAKYCM